MVKRKSVSLLFCHTTCVLEKHVGMTNIKKINKFSRELQVKK